MELNDLFYGVLGRVFDRASEPSKLTLLKAFMSAYRHWNIDNGDGSIDMLSGQFSEWLHLKAKYVAQSFGNGSLIVYGANACDNKGHLTFNIAEDTAKNLSLPSPDIIVERVTGRQYYIYIIN